MKLIATILFTIGFAASCGGSDDKNTVVDASQQPIDAATTPQDADTTEPDSGILTPDADTTNQLDFSCLGDPIPTTAPIALSISGRVLRLRSSGQFSPTAGIELEALIRNTNASLGVVTSNISGSFAFTVPNSSRLPLDAYIKATDPQLSLRDTYIYPATPVYQTLNNAQAFMVSPFDLTIFSTIALGGQSQSNAKGVVAIAVTDCGGDLVEGATVTTSFGGSVLYLDPTNPTNLSRTTTSQAGLAVLFNVDPGTLTINATTSGNLNLRENKIDVIAGAISSTLVVP